MRSGNGSRARVGPDGEPWTKNTMFVCMQKWAIGDNYEDSFCLANYEKALSSARAHFQAAQDIARCEAGGEPHRMKLCALKFEAPNARLSFPTMTLVAKACFRFSSTDTHFPFLEAAIDENECNLAMTASAQEQGVIKPKLSAAATSVIAEEDSHSRSHSSHTSISPAKWSEATKKLVELESRSPGVKESIWASGEDAACGEDCVAHCVAGQPRDFTAAKGLRKALKHRLFERFSESYAVFAVFVTSPYSSDGPANKDGGKGFARTQVGELTNTTSLLANFEEIGVHRAMLLYEDCQHPSCMENPSMQCDKDEYGLTAAYNETDNKVHNICDVQVKRFQTCMGMVRDFEIEFDTTFKWVARSRPDVYWVHPVGPASNLKMVAYFHSWAVAYGGMDWFYALPRDVADVFARFPDEASCGILKNEEIQKDCHMALGCECWAAAFFRKNKVKFEKFVENSYNSCIPAKFCGADKCPIDWDVNDESIENAGVQ